MKKLLLVAAVALGLGVLPVRAQADNRTSRRLTCLDLMQGRYEADSYINSIGTINFAKLWVIC